MRPLSWRQAWLAGGGLLVALVVVLSLLPPGPEGMPSGTDKIGHFLAYGTLAVWFGGVFERRRFAWIAVALIVLGAAMEFAQGFVGGREPDVMDALANTLGVALGLVACLVGVDQWCARVETRMGASRVSH